MDLRWTPLEERVVLNAEVPAEPEQQTPNDLEPQNDEANVEVSAPDGGDSADVGTRLLILAEDIDNPNTQVNEFETLKAAAVAEGTLVLAYDPESTTLEGLMEQIRATLSAAGVEEAAHVAFANHGNEGFFVLSQDANVALDALQQNGGDNALVSFFVALDDVLADGGRVDLLACNFLKGGDEVLDYLESSTGIDFAASTDLTGSAALDGNWILESDGVDVAPLYFAPAALSSWTGLLADQVPTEFTGTTQLLNLNDSSASILYGGSLDFPAIEWTVLQTSLQNADNGWDNAPDLNQLAPSAFQMPQYNSVNPTNIFVDGSTLPAVPQLDPTSDLPVITNGSFSYLIFPQSPNYDKFESYLNSSGGPLSFFSGATPQGAIISNFTPPGQQPALEGTVAKDQGNDYVWIDYGGIQLSYVQFASYDLIDIEKSISDFKYIPSNSLLVATASSDDFSQPRAVSASGLRGDTGAPFPVVQTYSDWSNTTEWGTGDNSITAITTDGSPYVQFLTGGTQDVWLEVKAKSQQAPPSFGYVGENWDFYQQTLPVEFTPATSFTGLVTGGTFDIDFSYQGGQDITVTLDYDATKDEVQSAIQEALNGITLSNGQTLGQNVYVNITTTDFVDDDGEGTLASPPPANAMLQQLVSLDPTDPSNQSNGEGTWFAVTLNALYDGILKDGSTQLLEMSFDETNLQFTPAEQQQLQFQYEPAWAGTGTITGGTFTFTVDLAGASLTSDPLAYNATFNDVTDEVSRLLGMLQTAGGDPILSVASFDPVATKLVNGNSVDPGSNPVLMQQTDAGDPPGDTSNGVFSATSSKATKRTSLEVTPETSPSPTTHRDSPPMEIPGIFSSRALTRLRFLVVTSCQHSTRGKTLLPLRMEGLLLSSLGRTVPTGLPSWSFHRLL